jgi:transcriptional regulator with XRE-family HTH domain
MARRLPPVSIRAQVLTALQQYTQAQLAARIGASARSIRRWKRGETEPLNAFVRLALYDEYHAERKRIKRLNRKQNVPDPPEVEVPLLGERRDLVLRDVDGSIRYEPEPDKHGEQVAETYKSEWVNYNVARLDVQEIFAILKRVKSRGGRVQVIFRVPQYEGGNRKVSAGAHWASGVFSLRGWTDLELWEGGPGFNGLAHYVTVGQLHRLLYVAVLDK